MSKYSHYIEGKIIPLMAERSTMSGDIAFVMSNLMRAVHNAINAGLHVAIAFPEYDLPSANERGGLGKRVRFFGDESDLEEFTRMPDVKMLIGQAAVNISDGVKVVPDDIKSWCIFKRDRRHERRSEMYKERENRRRAKKAGGELYKIRDIDPVPFVKMNSITNGQFFFLYINRITSAGYDHTKTLSSYGLNVTVPVF
jgi:CRISPR-associated endoribonuclease Cas6/Csy4 subtype I-F